MRNPNFLRANESSLRFPSCKIPMVTPIETKQESVWSDHRRGSYKNGMKAACLVQLGKWASWTSSVGRRVGRCDLSVFNKMGITSATGCWLTSDRWHWKSSSKLYLVSNDGLNKTMGRSSSIAKHLTRLCSSAPQKVRTNKLDCLFFPWYISLESFAQELLSWVCRESFCTETQLLDIDSVVNDFDPNKRSTSKTLLGYTAN